MKVWWDIEVVVKVRGVVAVAGTGAAAAVAAVAVRQKVPIDRGRGKTGSCRRERDGLADLRKDWIGIFIQMFFGVARSPSADARKMGINSRESTRSPLGRYLTHVSEPMQG